MLLHRPRSTVRTIVAGSLVIGLLTIWPMVSMVGAHANLVAASPAAGQQAGGAIDRVQLIFDEPVFELMARIEAPDGTLVSTTLEPISPQQFDLAFEPLEIEGIYRVRYRFLSLDTDRVELGHAFEFDRTAPAPLPITAPQAGNGPSGSGWQWLAVAVIAIVVVGLADRLRRRRRALAQLLG